MAIFIPPATPGGNASTPPTSGTHMQTLIAYGKWVLIFIVVIILLVWFGNATRSTKKSEDAQQAIVVAQQQVAAAEEAKNAERQQRVCGSMGQPSCKCKGPDTVMRYLGSRQVATVAMKGPVDFTPSPSYDGYKLCDPDSKDENGDYAKCVSGPDENIHVGITLVVVSTSTKEIPLKCEYR